jgi:hypothetical protein
MLGVLVNTTIDPRRAGGVMAHTAAPETVDVNLLNKLTLSVLTGDELVQVQEWLRTSLRWQLAYMKLLTARVIEGGADARGDRDAYESTLSDPDDPDDEF